MSALFVLLAAAAGFGAGWLARSREFRRRELAREKLFAFISHELTTPVTGIQLTVRNFLSGVFGEVADAHRPWYQMMNDQLDWAAALVADLNDLFHLEFGNRLRLDKASVALGELARESIERLRPQAERWGLKWTSEIADGLPSVDGDPYRLGRVFKSLLGHALKFSPQEGTVHLTVERGRGTPPSIRVEVRFQALESHAEDPRRIFDRFYPVDSGPRGKVLKTAGVGLNVAKEIVERHGGTLKFERDAAGPGRFIVTLPAREAA